MNHYVACWKKYAVSTGRTSRTEFWSWWLWNMALFFLFSLLLMFVTANALNASPPGQETPAPMAAMALLVISQCYILISLLPWIGATIRRLHDQDRSGYWILLALLPLIWGTVRRLQEEDGAVWWSLLNFICALGGIILLVILTLPGTEGENRFGAPSGA